MCIRDRWYIVSGIKLKQKIETLGSTEVRNFLLNRVRFNKVKLKSQLLFFAILFSVCISSGFKKLKFKIMSKHTNKVHGKLNFLMIAVVVVIGAVSYLLVESGTIDPSLGTSSGIKGAKKADKYVSKNEVVVELDGEEIQDVLNNPDFQRMIASGEFQKLASDEDFVKVLDNKDGIGILGDIFRSLDFVNNIDINI